MNYYERHIGDYLKDTAHLSLLQHGVYARLLDVYYTRESGIPAADAARLIAARSKPEMAALASVLSEFFELRDGVYTQERCMREIARYAESQVDADERRDNGKERQRRARDRRKQLFEQLRAHDLVPSFDTKTADLEAMLSRVTRLPSNADVTPPVTRDDTATHTQSHTQSQSLREKETTEPAVLVDRKALNGHGPPYRVPNCPYDELVESFHEQLPMLPHVMTPLVEARKTSLRARWVQVCTAERFDRAEGLAWFRDFFAVLAHSDFLTGRAKDWHASFDWLTKPKNFAKAVEGNYQGNRQ